MLLHWKASLWLIVPMSQWLGVRKISNQAGGTQNNSLYGLNSTWVSAGRFEHELSRTHTFAATSRKRRRHFSSFICQGCRTCYLGDGNLAAAAAFSTLTEGFNLNDIVLVDWQWQLQGGIVGLHHTGTAVFVLAVHHLREAETENDNNMRHQIKTVQTQCIICVGLGVLVGDRKSGLLFFYSIKCNVKTSRVGKVKNWCSSCSFALGFRHNEVDFSMFPLMYCILYIQYIIQMMLWQKILH